jgi:hypothetical protein
MLAYRGVVVESAGGVDVLSAGGGVVVASGAVVPGSPAGGIVVVSAGGGIVDWSAGGDAVSAGAVAAPSCFAHADANSNAVTLKNKALRFINFTSLIRSRFRLRFPVGGETTGRKELTSVRAPRSDVARLALMSSEPGPPQHSLCLHPP